MLESRVLLTAPTLSGVVANQSVNDSSSLAPFNTMTVNDPDNENMFARVTILNGVVRGDFLSGSTVGWNRTVVGNDIKYEQFLPPQPNIGNVVGTKIQGLSFQPRLNAIAPTTTELTDITVFVNDGQATATATVRVTTTSVNDFPSIGGAGTLSMSDSQIANPFGTLRVIDLDRQEALASVTILNGVVRGDFTNATSEGWNVRQVVGNNITYKRFFSPGPNVGATVETAFRTLTFRPRSNVLRPGATELTDFQVTFSDGIAPAVANTGTRVTVTSVNDVIQLSGFPANQTMNDNQTKAVFGSINVIDPDRQDMLARITIVNGVNQGDFTAASTTGWTRTVSGSNIVYTRYFATLPNIGAQVQPAIRALIFDPRNLRIGVTEETRIQIFLNDGITPVSTATTVTTTGVVGRPAAPLVAQPLLDSDTTTMILPEVPQPVANPLARLLKKPR